ncbi:MAG: type II toxin-antitoxin system PemK/MazF family toxin [Terracidiphilus sp.]
MRRGELYRLQNPPNDTKRFRIFVIVSRQSIVDTRFSTLVCAPIFSEGQGLSTQVRVGIDEGLKHESWIHCDGLTSIPKSELRNFVGCLTRGKLAELDIALRMALDLA